MKSFYKIKQAFAPVRKNVEPKDDFRILDSWAIFNDDEAKPKDKILEYICFHLETMNPETGEKQRLYKAVKFIRVIRLPAAAKQSTSLMDMHSSILSSLYKRETNFVCIIANVLDLGPFDEPLGLFFLYGVQGVAENITDAKRKADADMEGLIGSIIGTYRVLEAKFLDGLETEWLREKLTFMNFASVVRGIPFADRSGEDGGNKGMGGKNINPDSQGTLEEIISGMSDYEFILEVIASPVKQTQLTAMHKRNAELMTRWYPQLQGQTNLALNLSIPFMYAANSGAANGWSHNYTNAANVGTSHGTSVNMSYGQNVGENISHSLSESLGENNSVTVGNTIGSSHNYGISQNQGISHTVGTSETVGVSHNVGVSENQGISHSIGFSQNQGVSNNIGVSTNEGISNNIGNSHNWGNNLSSGTSNTLGVGTSDGLTQGVTVGETQGMSLTQGHNMGTSQGLSHGTSINESVSMNQNYGVSNNHSLGTNESTSYNVGRGFNENVSTGINQSQTTGVGQSFGTSQNTTLSNSVGHSWNASNGGSLNVSQGRNVNDSLGYSHNSGYSQNYGYSNSENFGTGFSQNHGTSSGMSGTAGSSGTVGGSAKIGGGLFPGDISGNFSGSNNMSVSNNFGQNDSAGFSSNFGRSSSENYGVGANFSDGVNVGRSVGQSNSISNGLSWNLGEGYNTNTGLSQGIGYNQGVSVNNSATVGSSYNQGFGSSINESFGTSKGLSESVSVGNSASLGYGSSIGFGENISSNSSISQGMSNSQGISMSDSVSNSLSRNHGISSNESVGINNSVGSSEGIGINSSLGRSQGWGQNQSIGTSYGIGQNEGFSNNLSWGRNESWGENRSIGQNESFGTSYGRGENESWGENVSRSQSESVGTSRSITNGESVGSSYGTSQSTGSGTSDTTNYGTSTSTGLGQTGTFSQGASSSMGLGPSLSYSKSHQWKNQQVEDLIEILTFKNNRLKASLREGAFYTYCYICCPSQKALDRAMAAAGSAWQNDQALAEPLQVLNLSPKEQAHILYHASAFSSDVTKVAFMDEREPKYRTILLPDELNAYTHLPRINEGGIFAEINDVPKYATPSRMQGDIYLGKIINAEHWSFERGYVSPYSYRLPESSLMHGIFTGASRSGKTVAAMRFIASLANVRRSKTNKRLRIVCLDPKRDWRGLAKYVDADRFRFYSLGNPDFHPIKLNVWKVPYGVRPQRWIDGVIDIYCRAYGLLERGKQMIADVVYYIYEQKGVFEAMNEKNWKDLVPELSAKVCFQEIYEEMEKRRDIYAGNGKAGNDTKDAYARLLERLSAFKRPYVIEHILFGTSDGMGIDDMIGDDNVTVLESEGLENTFKNFIFGVITSGFYQYAKGHEGGFLAEDQYETVLVIEEANEVLTGSDTASSGKDSTTLAGESPFEVLLDQSAGYGLFVMAITQKISQMPSSLIANVGLKFVGRLNVREDIEVAGMTIGEETRYEDRDFIKWLPVAPIGWFICQSSRGFDFKEAAPVMVKVEQLDTPDINDEELNEILLMSDLSRAKKAS